MSRKKTQEEYVNEVNIKNPTVEVIGEYIDARTPILHHCLVHNVYWDAHPQSILRGCGCKECSKVKIGNKLRKTEKQYKEELLQINMNVELVGKYIDSHTPILHRCLIDGYMWSISPNSILQGSGCPLCCGNIKKTTEQYVKELKEIQPNIEVTEEYINATTPIGHRCKIDGYQWKATPSSVLGGSGCAMCAGNAKKTTDEYAVELFAINPYVNVVGVYINATTPILHRCILDGNEWLVAPSNMLRGTGCPECKKRLLSQKFNKSHQQYVQDVSIVNPDIEVLGVYINSRTLILHRCKIDGYEWMARPYNILSGRGCSKCKESQGEKSVCQWLSLYGIEYKYQYQFDDCKDKKSLPFDFYIPQYNICIEYDGVQHFEPTDFAGRGEKWALDRFEATKYHDLIKTEYCKNNDIRLLRIPYYKNTEEELEKFFIHLI